MISWQAHDRPVYDLAFAQDGRLLTSGVDEGVCLWDVPTQTAIRRWTHLDTVALAVSPDGRWAVGAGAGRLSLWAVEGDDCRELVGRYRSEFATFSPDGGSVVGHGWPDPLFQRWAVPGGEELPRGWGGLRTSSPRSSGPLAFSPDGRLLATDDEHGAGSVIVLSDAVTGEELTRLWPSDTTTRATRLAFSPDGQLLASIHGPTMVLWDMGRRKEHGRGRVAKKRFKGVTFTADGKRLLTANDDSNMREWVAPTWDQTTIFSWKSGKLGCVAVSADGTLAAAGGSTGKVVVWDLD